MGDPSFLPLEYQSCFEEMRYYDTRQWEILKYLSTLAATAAGAQFAVYKLVKEPTAGFFATQSFLSFVVFAGSFLLYLMMLQNRIYFVYVTRQVNAVRKHMLNAHDKDFRKDNQMYTSVDFPAFKGFSIHTMQLTGATVISSLFAGASIYGLLRFSGYPSCLPVSFLAMVLVLAIEWTGGALYLRSEKGKTADAFLHGKRKREATA